MARRLDPGQPVTEQSALCLGSGRMALRVRRQASGGTAAMAAAPP